MPEERPRYRLTQKAYIRPTPESDMELTLPEGAEVIYLGEPGEHMEPLNDAAITAKASAKVRPLRPERTLPMQGGGEAAAMARAELGMMGGDTAGEALVALAARIGALEAHLGELLTALSPAPAPAPAPAAPPPSSVAAAPPPSSVAAAPPPPPSSVAAAPPPPLRKSA